MSRSERSYIRSSSFIMAALFTVLCGMAALSLGYFINYFTTGHFVHSTEAALNAQSALIEVTGMPKEGVQGEYLYRFLSPERTLPDDYMIEDRFSEGLIVLKLAGEEKRYAARIYPFDDGHKMLIGLDITQISKDFNFMQILGICSIIFVMIVVFVSYIISVFVVSGTNKIAQTAEEIILTGNLSRRIEVPSRWDDLSNMAAVLNTLLERVEELMDGVRRVSDNIAHDLRTPLARMRSHIETLQKKYGHADYAELLEEADHLLSTFTALLRIARLETEKQRSHFATLDLEQLIIDAAAFYEPLAEEKNIKLHAETTPITITGDKDLLFQAYANLLDNAIKFTPAGGKIKIALQTCNDKTVVSVEDNGNGVSEVERNKIFDRFYRTDKSRTQSGTGLGLSLVKAVIQLHRGRIVVQDADPGLRIITIL